MKNTKLKKEMAYLEVHYGSHNSAARALGIKPRTYRGYRYGEIPIPSWKQELIKDRVELLKLRTNSAA